MKDLIFFADTITNKISYWLLVGFCITLPYDLFYSEFILICFAIHTLIHCKSAAFKTIFSKEVLLVSSIFIMGTICIVYSPDKAEALNITGKQLAIIFIPVILALTGLDLKKYQMNICYFFAFSCTGTIIYLYADAFHTISYFKLPASSLFTLAFMNHNFSLPIDIHATYLSMYVAFSIIIMAYSLTLQKRGWIQLFISICIFILAAGLLQLASRAVLIALLLVINIAFPFFILKGKKRIQFIIVSLSLSGVILFAIINIDSFKVRYINELKKDLANKVILFENNEPRMARWEMILKLIKKSPIIGYGTGAENKMLKENYFENKLYSSYVNEFNTHSEYLSILLKMGLIGLALYLFVLFWGVKIAWREKELLFFGFLMLISITGIAENVLDLNKGIFFYSFFFSFFLLKEKQKKDNNSIMPPIIGNPVLL